MRILDLFCGAGGFALGFLLASPKFTISLAIDNDYRVFYTYAENIEVGMTLIRDIQDIHSLEILKVLQGKSPDIILSSPPCESFSLANPNRQKSAYDQLYSDEKGRLVLDAIRIIIDLEPKIFLIENVQQLASTEMRELILHEFSYSKYESIYFNFLEAETFGVPSQRKRVFISNIELASLANNSFVSVAEAFFSLPDPNLEVSNHRLVHTSPRITKKIHKLPPGGAIVYFKGSQGGTFRNFIRLKADQPSPTVMGKSRFIHPYDPRLCTVREHARLMSYPDEFHFFGPINWQYNQVGESVPPLLAKAIAQQILMMFLEN
ncbi:MAG: DNA cytosine methyltransferase [Promethearchaeota archaeon]